jgi:integrase
LLEREFVRQWQEMPVAAITKQHVIQAIDQIVDRGSPSAARHAFAAIRGPFNWAMKSGYIDSTPCAMLGAPGKQRSRDRVLSDLELGRIHEAAKATPFPFGPIVRLLILTAQRRSEVSSMRWADIDLPNRLWPHRGSPTNRGATISCPTIRSRRSLE